MKEKDLEGMFSPFGTVISTRILRDNNGVSRGVGFCRMESKEKCSQIIEAFNGHMVQGNRHFITQLSFSTNLGVTFHEFLGLFNSICAYHEHVSCFFFSVLFF